MTISLPDHDTIDLSGLTPLHPVIPHVVVYGKPVCPNCDILKRQMLKRGLTPISIDLTQVPDAYAQFSSMNLLATPIVVVHNVFERPVFFWGKGAVPVDQTKLTSDALRERFAHLIASNHLTSDSVDQYLLDMAARANDRSPRTPGVSPVDFVEFAHTLAPESHSVAKRVHLAPGNELTSNKAQMPAIAMS